MEGIMTYKTDHDGNTLTFAPEEAAIPMNTEPTPSELPATDAIPYSALLLSAVYIQAGLPPEAALRAAMADYEHNFSSWDLKLI
jgi:hypothetical protein